MTALSIVADPAGDGWLVVYHWPTGDGPADGRAQQRGDGRPLVREDPDVALGLRERERAPERARREAAELAVACRERLVLTASPARSGWGWSFSPSPICP